jgi:hypothetical protein
MVSVTVSNRAWLAFDHYWGFLISKQAATNAQVFARGRPRVRLIASRQSRRKTYAQSKDEPSGRPLIEGPHCGREHVRQTQMRNRHGDPNRGCA